MGFYIGRSPLLRRSVRLQRGSYYSGSQPKQEPAPFVRAHPWMVPFPPHGDSDLLQNVMGSFSANASRSLQVS